MEKLNSSTTERDFTADVVRVRILPDGRMSRKDAALYLGIEPKTLAIWATQGKGPRVAKVASRAFYYKQDLDSFIRGDQEISKN